MEKLNGMRLLKLKLFGLLLVFVGSWGFSQTAGVPPVLEFPVTGDSKAQLEFTAGVIALHGSAYDLAAEHFRTAQKIDPNFVMAYWGEAMCFNHPFWNQQ